MRRAPVLLVAVSLTVALPSWPVAQSSPTAPRTEQEWVVSAIVDRLYQLARLGAKGEAPPSRLLVSTVAASPAVFTVTVGDAAPAALRIVGHLWDPRAYEALARPWLTPVKRSAATRADGEAGRRLLEALLTPSTALLLSEDRRVSADLRRAPTSAGHEQAALLAAALLLREAAGDFTDERPALSRLTAHLAVAAALRDGAAPGPAGTVAAAVLLAAVGRERDALVAVDPIAATGTAAEQAWARVVQLRATGNWRRLAWPGRATPLERLEYGRALVQRIGDPRLLAWMDDVQEPPTLAWTRIALDDGFSVESGNRFTATGLVLELEDAARVWQEHRGGPVGETPAALMADLADADRAATPAFRVLDWPLWAGAAERHLAARAVALHRHQLTLLGRRERADEVRQLIDTTLAGLRLLPLVQVLIAPDEAARTTPFAAAAGTLRAEPWRHPPALWHLLAARRPRQAALPLPTADVWFSPWMPDGTQMRPVERDLRPRSDPPAPTPTLERWHAQAPSEAWLAWTLAWRQAGGAPALGDARRRFGSLLEYDVRPHRWMLRDLAPSPADELSLATAACELDVDHCAKLAELHLRDGRDVEAALEYERWFRRASNRVLASNNVGWLVRYLIDSGATDRARGVADAAAEVGSGGGLEVRGEWLERLGRHDEAEAVFARIADRYASPRFLGVYYLRRSLRSASSVDRVRGIGLLQERLPHGLEPVRTDGPPLDGVTFASFGERAARAGLQKADVIVGMHGHRVRTTDQAWVFSRLAFDDAVTFVVWRDGRYETVSGRLGQQTLGAALKNYTPPATSR